MEIKINKNLAEFKPGNEQEAAEFEKLWKILISCTQTSKKLVPVGEYIPGCKDTASFFIEGLSESETPEGEELEATEAYSCENCNRVIYLKPGELPPICCGISMKSID